MNLAPYIEQTNLSPTLTHKDIDLLIEQAKQYQFAGICVPPFWIKKARRDLGNSTTKLVTVIGFPLGYNMTETKVQELQLAIDNGADELDLVVNSSALKAEMSWVKVEIAKCAQLAHEQERILKVIIETAYLNDRELELVCSWSAAAGADYVKTSTGFAPTGAKVEDIKKMRELLPAQVGIKASGGIKTREQAIELIKAGADRLGTSSGVSLMQKSNSNAQSTY
jgi:deoxyribose-phosphate aldolase